MDLEVDNNIIYFENDDNSSLYSSFNIKNISANTKLYKIKSKIGTGVAIKPAVSIIKPFQTERVTIKILKEKLDNRDLSNFSNDILILGLTNNESINKDLINTYFQNNMDKVTDKIKIKCLLKNKESSLNNMSNLNNSIKNISSKNLNITRESKVDYNIENQIEEYKLKIQKQFEEKNKIENELNTLKNRVEFTNIEVKPGFQLWQLIMVALISMLIGGFLNN